MSATAGEADAAGALSPPRRPGAPARLSDIGAGIAAAAVILAAALAPGTGTPDLALAIAVGSAIAITASGVLDARGPVRFARGSILLMEVLWLCALVAAVLSPARGTPDGQRLGFVLLTVGVLPAFGWIAWLVREQPTVTARRLIYLDVGALALSVMAIVVAVAGIGRSPEREPADALILLASPTLIIGVASMGAVAAAASGRRLRPLDAAYVLAAGIGLLGISGMAIRLEVLPAGSIRTLWVIVGLGALIVASASRRLAPVAEVAGPPHPVAETLRRELPLLAVVVAGLTLIPGPENDTPILEFIQTLSVVAAVALVVVRQSLLMRDRESLLRQATQHATVAERAHVEANRAADESTAALARLADAEERYRALVERLPAVVYVDAIDPADPNGRADSLYLAPQVEALTGYASHLFAEQTELWDSLVHPDDRPGLDVQYERHGRDGTPLRVTYRIRDREGRIVWVEEHASVIGMTDEGYRLSQGVIVDVTEQRTLEEQLLAAQRMEAVGRLAGGVAHDFNNLLTAILGYASIVESELPEGDPLREDVTAITQAAGSASSLVRQLLAFSRRQMLRPEELDLSVVVDRVVPLLRRLAGERVVLTAALGVDLPAVRADPGQLEQVLVNLVVNARDAMADGGTVTLETSEVQVSETEARLHLGLRPGHYVALAVTDTGSGMDQEVRRRVFEPFFTTKEPGRGTGLGLATVYGIVKQSDGYIGVTSEPGRGSSFRVLLPALAAPAVTTRAVPSAPLAAERGAERILLVEDEETVRLLAATVLRRLGYTVEVAADGRVAIEILERESGAFQVVVSDMVMPGIGGTELARTVRERWPAMGIVLMSGYAAEIVGREGPGIEDAFLAKPFAPQALGAAVRAVLDQRSERPSKASSAAMVADGSSTGRSET